MRLARFLPVLACMVLLLPMQDAWAHRSRVHTHIGIGFGPIWGPFWSPSPWSYYPPVVVTPPPPPPPVYIEQPRPAPAATEYWYFCRSAGAYYPYVRQCPEAWQPVPPVPEQ